MGWVSLGDGEPSSHDAVESEELTVRFIEDAADDHCSRDEYSDFKD